MPGLNIQQAACNKQIGSVVKHVSLGHVSNVLDKQLGGLTLNTMNGDIVDEYREAKSCLPAEWAVLFTE